MNLLLLLFSMLSAMTSPYKPLVKATELKHYPNAVIIDARGGPDARDRYNRGHLPGALFVDLEMQLSHKEENAKDGGRHPLPKIENFAKLLGELGISNETLVLVYDDKNGGNAAARFWWMMRSVGHENVWVIDGGLQAVEKSGIALSAKEESAGKVARYEAKAWLLPVVSIDEVKKASTTGTQLIMDVRETYRYNGESEPIDKIAGHIPGAINIPYIDNLNKEGEFLSTEELKSKYEKALGGKKPEEVIVHCGSGVTACHTLLAMEQAGISGAKLYVGSWSEWSRNDLPMVVK